MDIPPIASSVWPDLITGKIKKEFTFLGLKIVLTRLRMKLLSNNSHEMRLECANELRELFIQNINIPKAQNDLTNILTRETQS